jgi:hypothetical protein
VSDESEQALLTPMLEVGRKVIITTDNWFYGPDGKQYRSIYGTVRGVFNDEQTLGIRTNNRSSNWYARIGGMVVAGCQIHYVCAAACSPPDFVSDFSIENGNVTHYTRPSVCLNADAVEEPIAQVS